MDYSYTLNLQAQANKIEDLLRSMDEVKEQIACPGRTFAAASNLWELRKVLRRDDRGRKHRQTWPKRSEDIVPVIPGLQESVIAVLKVYQNHRFNIYHYD